MATTHIDYRKIDYDQLIDKPITRVASGVNPNTLTTAGVYDRGDGNRFIVTVDGQNITQVIEEKDGYQTRSSTDGGTTWTTWDEVEFSKSGDIDAEDVNYDNTTSGLTATNVQDAIDEIDTSVDTINTTITNIQTDITEIKDIVEVETMPTPGEESEGTIIQYKGATTSTFTHGYFYECVGDGQDPETFSRVNIQVQDNPAQAEVMPTPSAENVGQIIQYAGDTNNYYTHAHFYEVIEDPENPGQYIYKEVEVQDSPAQSEDMPEADEDTVGTIIQYIGETDANFTHGYFYECISDGQDPATYSWTNVKVQDGEQTVYLTQEQYDALPSSKLTDGINYVVYSLGDVNPVDGESVQVDVLPAASEDIVGAIHQYVGVTTANYTNGYFYKCVSDGAVTPTYSREQINVQPASSGGEGHEVITQAAYDALTPEQKAEKVYMIKESGTPTPVGPVVAENVEYDNTTSRLVANNVQDAIDELSQGGIMPSSGTSLSYNDTTCYAGEEIHENDFISTNGTSFNPNRTDTSTSVGGTTINKYAIGFIGNGKSTDTFSIKTSVIEGAEPDSVTINIESDDNGKPSGTALATSSSLDVFKSNTSLSDLVDVGSSQTIYDSIQRFYFSNLGENEGNISYDKTTGIITVSGETYNYTLDISGVTGYVASMDLCNISPCDKYLYFNLSNSLYQLYLPNYFSTEGAEITQITAELSSSVNKQKRGAFDRTGHFFAINCADVNNDYKRGILYTETPFDLTNYTVVYNETSYRALGFAFMEYLGNSFVAFTGYYSSGHAYKGRIIKLNPDGTIEQSEQFIQSYYSGSDNDHIRCDIREKENIIYWKQNASSGYYAKKLGLERDYNYNLAKTFTVDSSVSATKGTKYRLTITPVVTGSYVDSIKIYEKEGNYYSDCMSRDTNLAHDWESIQNRTPYIDSDCIQARYARKNKLGDSLSDFGGFANGNYTELASVQYTYQGLKTGFSGLESGTNYYSDNNGGITADAIGSFIGKAVNGTDLLVSPTRTVNTSFAQTGGGKVITAMCDETALIMSQGSCTVTGVTVYSETLKDSYYTYVKMVGLKQGETYRFQTNSYTTGGSSYTGRMFVSFF